MPRNGQRTKVKALVKHPDYKFLIPCTCSNRHGTILVEFEGQHPDLGSKLTFTHFIKDGIIQVGNREY